MTRSCGRGCGGALWLVHGWVGYRGGLAAQTQTISCGNRTPGVALLEPPRGPIVTPGLSDPSGSDLRVMSHDVKCVVGMDIYSGL